jgi:sugar phosphate permease
LLWDRFGIGVSGICAIHCLFLPVIVSVLPLWPALASVQEWLHPVSITLLIPIVYYAARRGHFEFKITAILVSGLILVMAGWLIGHYWLGLWFEATFTFAGSIILITGHWLNYRHHRRCTNRSHKHHPVQEEELEEFKQIEEVI